MDEEDELKEDEREEKEGKDAMKRRNKEETAPGLVEAGGKGEKR